MNELHRLTLRQINENITIMSDEVFVPAEEVDELLAEIDKVKQLMLDPNQVHVAMLRGVLARISMATCAHTWGAKEVERWNRSDELRADLKTVSDLLVNFDGDTPWQQAQAAVAHIDWLENELKISKHNEQAFMKVLEQERGERFALRSQNRLAREVMNANDPLNARTIFGPPTEGDGNEQSARQTTGTESAK